jgi:hypothetical protein
MNLRGVPPRPHFPSKGKNFTFILIVPVIQVGRVATLLTYSSLSTVSRLEENLLDVGL